MSLKEEQARTIELQTSVWSYVARSLLRNSADPYKISASGIESNKGRQKKAFRLLAQDLMRSGTKSNRWGTPELAFKIDNFEQKSKELGEAPTFVSQWEELHDSIFGSRADNDDTVSSVGYKSIAEVSDKEAIYIYWHQDEYDVVTVGKEPHYYPKTLQEIHTIAVLRSIVEQYHQDNFVDRLERYLDLPKDSLQKKGKVEEEEEEDNGRHNYGYGYTERNEQDHYTVSVRNFCARAADLTHERYFGDLGFLAEYEHYRLYFEALSYKLQTLNTLIQGKGGHEAITKEMRKATIQELMESAPLNISYAGGKKDETDFDEESNRYRSKHISKFILKHANYFDYDTIYGEDPSILYIKDDSVQLPDQYMKKNAFKPKKRDLEIIHTYTKEREKCLAQKISGTSQSIS